VACPACGARTTREPHVTSADCPFCGTHLLDSGAPRRLIRPASLLPFRVKRDDATRSFHAWLRSLWFAPGALREQARRQPLDGVYVPFWTYDCRTVSDYTGMRGDDYWDQVAYTAMEGGRRRRRTRRVRRTRWQPAGGRVRGAFDDVLILASRSLPPSHAARLEPWDLSALVPYRDEYLSGFRAEAYQIDLAEGWEQARQAIEPRIREAVCRDIGGDRQRILSLQTRHEDVTFKHLLLPVWVSTYRFGKRLYRFLVNARTGEVQGERPWSWWKIGLAAAAALGVAALLLWIAGG